MLLLHPYSERTGFTPTTRHSIRDRGCVRGIRNLLACMPTTLFQHLENPLEPVLDVAVEVTVPQLLRRHMCNDLRPLRGLWRDPAAIPRCSATRTMTAVLAHFRFPDGPETDHYRRPAGLRSRHCLLDGIETYTRQRSSQLPAPPLPADEL